MSIIVEHAPAKINLTLEIAGRRGDGYHELSSIVAFAELGDTVALDPDAPPGLAVDGPMADALTGDNIVTKVLTVMSQSWPQARLGRITLTKRLPVAGGIGGGSADAAATLRAIARLNAGTPHAPDWTELARRLGADVPVCLHGRLCLMTGMGERIRPLPPLAPLHAVLVNPRRPLATARVFAELAAPSLERESADDPPALSRDEVVARIRSGGNDLQAPAIRLVPEIAHCLEALGTCTGAEVIRMSGSGPTCFALFADAAAAQAGARQIAHEHPSWWVEATTLT